MKRTGILIITLQLCSPAFAYAENFATCLLKELPGVQSDNIAHAAISVCTARHPEQYSGIVQGSGRGLFSYDSGAECALEKGKSTRSNLATRAIRIACNRLYDNTNLNYYKAAQESHPGDIEKFLNGAPTSK